MVKVATLYIDIITGHVGINVTGVGRKGTNVVGVVRTGIKFILQLNMVRNIVYTRVWSWVITGITIVGVVRLGTKVVVGMRTCG